MPRLAKQVNKEQVIKALEYIITNDIELNGSTVHNLIYKGKAFPPKEVVRWAARLAKIPNWENMGLSGGDDTNAPLAAMGFEIKAKGDNSVSKTDLNLSVMPLLKEAYQRYRDSEDYKIRQNQFKIVPVLKEIIAATLAKNSITNSDYTGFIQMFKFGCTDPIFDKYLKANISDEQEFKRLHELAYEANEFGYTGAGLNSVTGLPDKDLHAVKDFLLKAFDIDTVSDAVKLCRDFEALNVSQIKSGIFSPWLYYINPSLFPILNNSHNDFRKLLNISPIYSQTLEAFQFLKNEFGEEDLGMVDFFAHQINKYLDQENTVLQKILKELGTEVAKRYLSMLKKLVKELDLDSTSEKVYFNYEKDTLIFGVGQRYAFNVSTKGFYTIISKHKTSNAIEEFAEERAFLTNYSLTEDITSYYDELLLATKEILAVTKKTSYYKFDKKDFRTLVFDDKVLLSEKMQQENSTVMQQPLNQILYGPPGTGKTYHTINKALAIVESKTENELAQESREELKQRYQEYVAKGQIVFITFHQSMSYEDFVEGIKPEVEEDKEGLRSVVYDVNDGIFKSLCAKARVSTVKDEKQVVYEFDEAWNDLLAEVRWAADAMDDFVLDILTPNRGLKVTEITDQGNLRITPLSVEGLTYTVSYTRAKKLQAAFPDLSVVKNIDKEFRAVIGGSNSTAYWAVINDLNKKIAKNQSVVEVSSDILKPHVLIIDEINRGNVSAIFGELITLIEESKRAGASEALELTLPYSKEKFSVPSNLYIIGTMNTADRSVEALDTALRRRFAFEEMMPEPSKITIDGALKENEGMLDGVDLAAVLRRINERIEVLLDMDHQIGHSYLINVNDTNGLANAFNNCIVPLLKEYFYHDDEKIALVLGAGFVNVREQSSNIQALFPVMQGLEVHAIDGKQKFELKPITPDTIIAALQTLLSGG